MYKLIQAIGVLCFPFFLVAQAQELYISDAGNFQNPPWQILKYDVDGSNGTVFIKEHLGWPQDIVFLEHKNEVLIANLTTNQITRHHSESGEYLGIFAKDIQGPTRMVLGTDSLLYVLQWKNKGKVLRYNLEGDQMPDYTDKGIGASIGMDWDQEGNFYVSSYGDKIIYKFDGEGKYIGEFINSGLEGPTNIWFQDDLLYVIDYTGGSIKIFDKEGNFVDNFISGIKQGEGVAFISEGKIAIGFGETSSVKLFNWDGDFEKDLIPSGALGLKTPNAVVLRTRTTSNLFEQNIKDQLVQPAIGRRFNLNWTVNNQIIEILEIYDEQGKKIFRTSAGNHHEWIATDIPGGIYFVHATTQNKQVIVQKIIIQ